MWLYLRNKNVIFFQIMENRRNRRNRIYQYLIFSPDMWILKIFFQITKINFLIKITSSAIKLLRAYLNLSALAVVRARSFPRHLVSSRRHVDGGSGSGGRGRLQSCRDGRREPNATNGVSRAGWSVTRVWCVHARATDAIQPTCEEGVCATSRVVMTFAWVAANGV